MRAIVNGKHKRAYENCYNGQPNEYEARVIDSEHVALDIDHQEVIMLLCDLIMLESK